MKTALELIDPTGTWVMEEVSDPELTIASNCTSIGERSPAPDFQLLGPVGEYEWADLFPSPAAPYPSQAGQTWDQIKADWSEIPDTWNGLT